MLIPRFLSRVPTQPQVVRVSGPPDAGNLEMWLDSRELSGADLSAVTFWPDTAGAPLVKDVSQATAIRQPLLLVTTDPSPNGVQMVRFNGFVDGIGNSDGMATGLIGSAGTPFIDFTGGATLYFYGRWRDVGFSGPTQGPWFSSSRLDSFFFFNGIYTYENSGGVGVFLPVDGIALGRTGLLLVTFVIEPDPTVTPHTCYVNAVPVSTQATLFPSARASDADNMSIMAFAGGGGHSDEALSGDLGTLMWYRGAHTPAQVSAVRGFINDVWGGV